MPRWVPLVLSLLSVPLFAQHEHDAGTPRPVTLDHGVGNAHFAVSTQNAEAQQFFDQGMQYVYAFNHEEAVRSFTHAGELDPNLAMAWWGVALALGPNINMDVDPDREKQAYDAVQTAAGKTASPKERELIAALQKRYTNDPAVDLHKLALDYSAAMGGLAKKYADDADVDTLYVESLMDLRPWKFWAHDGTPAEGTDEIVSVLEGVLAKHPHHVGANHYLIHALEASPHPERAIAAAERLPKLAPNAGHIVHMPAHIFQRTGNYAEAARANENGAVVDREYIKTAGNGGMYPTMYYNHNLQFGSASYAMVGRYDDARRMGDEFAANAAMLAKDIPPVEFATAWPQLLALRSGRWLDVIRMKPAGAGPLSTALSHFARGVAFAKIGNVLGAQSEQKALESARTSLTDDVGFMQNPARAIGELASHALAAQIAEASGATEEALAQFRQAVMAEDALNYNEPSDWAWPTRESLGAALLRAGRNADAEGVFREDLKRNPHNPRSLYGLASALRAQGKDAASMERAWKKLWQGRPLSLAQY
jgi:tetratricopeptide (TPR) repeat protein